MMKATAFCATFVVMGTENAEALQFQAQQPLSVSEQARQLKWYKDEYEKVWRQNNADSLEAEKLKQEITKLRKDVYDLTYERDYYLGEKGRLEGLLQNEDLERQKLQQLLKNREDWYKNREEQMIKNFQNPGREASKVEFVRSEVVPDEPKPKIQQPTFFRQFTTNNDPNAEEPTAFAQYKTKIVLAPWNTNKDPNAEEPTAFAQYDTNKDPNSRSRQNLYP